MYHHSADDRPSDLTRAPMQGADDYESQTCGAALHYGFVGPAPVAAPMTDVDFARQKLAELARRRAAVLAEPSTHVEGCYFANAGDAQWQRLNALRKIDEYAERLRGWLARHDAAEALDVTVAA